MGIGLGIVLIVVGAILVFALDANLPFVSDDTLGIILIVAGVVALILSLVMNAQRGTHPSRPGDALLRAAAGRLTGVPPRIGLSPPTGAALRTHPGRLDEP